MVAPGGPGPGMSGAGAIACGAIRLRICANARFGAKRATGKAAAAMAQRQKLLRPRPDMPTFFDVNRGNFKPERARRAPQHSRQELAQDWLWKERRL